MQKKIFSSALRHHNYNKRLIASLRVLPEEIFNVGALHYGPFPYPCSCDPAGLL
jgi:hypothetical protein